MPRAPVDIEKQCGVIHREDVACARALTCKSHSMGSKRAVPGRSMPFDMLLADFQRKNEEAKRLKEEEAATRAALDGNDVAHEPVTFEG